MNIITIFLIAVVVLLAYQFVKVKMSQAKPEEIKNKISEGALLVDVRTPQEFASGSVKGAVNIPLDSIPSSLQKFKDKKHIVVFSRSGNRSAHAKSILESHGIENISNGGTWQNVSKLT